jgi:hypothetical protein
MRMTRISRTNLTACDSAQIEPAAPSGFLVRLQKSQMVAYITSTDGVVVYPTVLAARRAIKRIRPDLEPTSFDAESAGPR